MSVYITGFDVIPKEDTCKRVPPENTLELRMIDTRNAIQIYLETKSIFIFFFS